MGETSCSEPAVTLWTQWGCHWAEWGVARCERWIPGNEMLISAREFIFKKVRGLWPSNLDRGSNLWFFLLVLKTRPYYVRKAFFPVRTRNLTLQTTLMFFEALSKITFTGEFKRIISLEILKFHNYWISFISTNPNFFTKENKEH